MTRLHQQTEGCSDFDVAIGDESSPSFRVLLPEWIRGRGVKHEGLLHIIPGTWQEQSRGMRGHFAVPDQFGIDVEIETRETGIGVRLTVENTGDSAVADVWLNVCAALNHLPGSPGWTNRRFFPSVALDRAVQGRHWYEVLSPGRLFAVGADGWEPMHPNPDRPDAGAVPAYSFVPSPTAHARACAVESPDGGVWFFQSWDTPCRWCTPCPGNACMHLEPFLAEVLAPGASWTLRGHIGLHSGDRQSLQNMLSQSNVTQGVAADGGQATKI